MKILGVMANEGGSAYYRQYVPFLAMREAGLPVNIVNGGKAPNGILEAHDVVQILRVAKEIDAVIEVIRDVQRQGKRVVVDYDDDLINIPAHNPAHSLDRNGVIRAIEAADAVVVTNDSLASVYRPYAKRVAVIPNYVDTRKWPTPPQRTQPLTIGLVGSPSHHEDWKLIAEPMRRIREKYDVQFLVAGYLPDYLKGIVTEFVGWQSVLAYQHTVNRIDIGLCPLHQDDFNKRKTPIKAMEYALAGAAVVASPTLYREMVSSRGTIARTEADWFNAIESYITNPLLRQQHATALQAYVTRTCDVHRNARSIYQTYRQLFK